MRLKMTARSYLGSSVSAAWLFCTCLAGASSALAQASDGQTDASPMIVLPMFSMTPQESEQGAPAVEPVPQAGTLQRDSRTNNASQVNSPDNWLMGLRPPRGTPEGMVRMGPSIPTPGLLRITGETADVDLSLNLPDGIPFPNQITLVIRSSVNNSPERSTISLRVNGGDERTWPLKNIDGWGEITFPATGLHSGTNTISLNLKQPHRIFCGPEASFGVWSEIDLHRSGAILPDAMVPVNASSFRLLLTDSVAAGQPIDLRMEDGVDQETLAQVMAGVRASLPEVPSVKVLSPYAPASTGGQRVGISLIKSGSEDVRFLRSPSGSLIMRVSAGPKLAEKISTVLGVVSPYRDVPMLVPGRTTSFKAMGQDIALRNTRFAEVRVPFALPEGWLLMASQRARLNLHYGFADDLTPNSVMSVKINGQTIRLLPLDRNGGAIMPILPIDFPANMLKSGTNLISFEMMVPGNPPTLECPAHDTDMLAILPDSSIEVPVSPDMTLGDGAASLGRIGPSTIEATGGDPAIALPFQGRFSLLDAITGESNRSYLRIAQLPGDMAGISDNAIMRRDELARLLLGETTVVIREANVPQNRPLEKDEPGLKLSSRGLQSDTTAFATPDDEPKSDIFAQLRVRVKNAWTSAFPDSQTLERWLEGKSALAVLYRTYGGDGDVWWYILGPDITPINAAKELDDFRRNAGAGVGQVSLLGKDGNWDIWPPNPTPKLNGPLTPKNVLSVLGNYASWAPSYFALIVLVLALISVIPAYAFIRLTRRKGDRQ